MDALVELCCVPGERPTPIGNQAARGMHEFERRDGSRVVKWIGYARVTIEGQAGPATVVFEPYSRTWQRLKDYSGRRPDEGRSGAQSAGL